MASPACQFRALVIVTDLAHCNSYNFKCLDPEIRDGSTFSSAFCLLNFLCFGGDCVEQQVKVLQVGDK
jgi:hypothetical protein